MPNYHYKCGECKGIAKMDLPISTDPKKTFRCFECGYAMRRIIVSGAQFPEKVGRVWAGDWFKKTYGHDMTEGAERRVREREKYEKDKKDLAKEGFRFSHKSRQVGGKNRIKIPDKKEE